MTLDTESVVFDWSMTTPAQVGSPPDSRLPARLRYRRAVRTVKPAGIVLCSWLLDRSRYVIDRRAVIACGMLPFMFRLGSDSALFTTSTEHPGGEGVVK